MGCQIIGMFIGAFIYANDITLMTQSRESMSYVANLYATKQDILFNPLKNHCMFLCKCKILCSPYSRGMILSLLIQVNIWVLKSPEILQIDTYLQLCMALIENVTCFCLSKK